MQEPKFFVRKMHVDVKFAYRKQHFMVSCIEGPVL